MAEDDGAVMGGAFNALFAAAEASIDRLAEEKRAQTDDGQSDPAVAPSGESDEDIVGDITPDAGDEGAAEAAPEPLEDDTAPPPRRILNPIHRRRAARPMPARKTPRLPESQDDESKPKANTADAAVTQSLIKARNELTELLEAASQANQALMAEKLKLEQRVAKLKANQETGRQRATREKEDAVSQARDKVLKEFLPVVDNLERAVSIDLSENAGAASAQFDAFRTGVENVLRLFLSSLRKMNVEGYSALGQPFDPSIHEAIRRLEEPSKPANTVVEEYQKGYLVDGRLLRPAVVVVATGGPKQLD